MQTAEPYITHTWQWRGHNINYAVAGCGPPILFVHGFGASLGHFRRNVPALSQTYKVCCLCIGPRFAIIVSLHDCRIMPPSMRMHAGQVYAIDLLGFGRSDKPLLDYSTELWRDQLLDFLAEFVDAPAVLVGNSIGSLVSLMVRAGGLIFGHISSVPPILQCAPSHVCPLTRPCPESCRVLPCRQTRTRRLGQCVAPSSSTAPGA